MEKKIRKISLSLIIGLVLSLTLVFFLRSQEPPGHQVQVEREVIEDKLKIELDPNLSLNQKVKKVLEEDLEYRARILATGDIIYHQPLYLSNYDQDLGQYRLDGLYEEVRDFLAQADLVIGNFESTINPNRPLSGYPMFNAPLEAAQALRNDGFHVLSTANNHCLDTGLEGISTTIDALDQAGLKHFGTYKDNYSPLIIEVNQIKLGFISASEIFNGLESLVPEDRKGQISPMDEDLLVERIRELRDLGSDFIIAYPHWGWEYSQSLNPVQKKFNQIFLENGVDAILGSHPHVLQRAETVIRDHKKVFTIYSMGNSISNQRYQWLGHPGVESGVFVELNLVKKNDLTSLEEVILHPTYVNRFLDENGRYQSQVLLYQDILEGGKFRSKIPSSQLDFVDQNYTRVLESLDFHGDLD